MKLPRHLHILTIKCNEKLRINQKKLLTSVKIFVNSSSFFKDIQNIKNTKLTEHNWEKTNNKSVRTY